MLIQVAIEQNTIKIAIQYILSNFNLLKNTFFNSRLTNLLLKMVKKRCVFKNLEVNLKKPGKNSKKTWKKFRKPEENFQKAFGHPVIRIKFTGM